MLSNNKKISPIFPRNLINHYHIRPFHRGSPRAILRPRVHAISYSICDMEIQIIFWHLTAINVNPIRRSVWSRNVSAVEHYRNAALVTRKENEGCYYPCNILSSCWRFLFPQTFSILVCSHQTDWNLRRGIGITAGKQCTPSWTRTNNIPDIRISCPECIQWYRRARIFAEFDGADVMSHQSLWRFGNKTRLQSLFPTRDSNRRKSNPDNSLIALNV